MFNMLKVLLTYLFVLFFFNYQVLSKEIWIYSDEGTWEEGIISLEQFFSFYNIPHKRIYSNDLNNINDYSNTLAICIPGGFAYYYKIKLNEFAINNIRNYVSNGGSYIGICAGAYFASSKVIWEGVEYDYPLNLFDGKTIGSLHDIAKWDKYKMTNISLNAMNFINKGFKKNWSVLYYGGPYFESNKTNFENIAFWNEYQYLPAIINFYFGNGKVLLIGPHLEIEENSDRDSNDFASNLNDYDSDWDLLYNLIKWAVNINTKVDSKEYKNLNFFYVIIRDNNLIIEFKEDLFDINNYCIEIFNILGYPIYKNNFSNLSDLKNKQIIIDISNFSNGVYFIKLNQSFLKTNIIK